MISGPLPPGKFPDKPRPSHRLTRPWMFKAVLEKGKSLKSPPLNLRYLGAEPVDMTRLGFIVRKKTGNAVMRNSIRRVLREVFRRRQAEIQPPAWVVFDVQSPASSLTRTALRLKGEELVTRLILSFQPKPTP